MIKKGFTLAEVLITLTIVGVIAAITLPTFTASTTNAQIGPKLAKSVSMFEQANTSLLNKYNVDSLTDGDLFPDNADTNEDKLKAYVSNLRRYLKIDQNGISKDGVEYKFSNADNTVAADIANNNPPHAQRIGRVRIDINGTNNPNRDGTDQFYFSFWNDGSLRPKGAVNWDGTEASKSGGNEHWIKKCNINSAPTSTGLQYCAGHIFENNMKVLYR